MRLPRCNFTNNLSLLVMSSAFSDRLLVIPQGCEPSQLKSTPGTYRVLHDVLGEMGVLFEDPVFHIGADETFVKVRLSFLPG